MKRVLRLLFAENKRAWKLFPKMLLQAIVPVLVTGAVAFCASKMLYQDETVTIKVAVVLEEENTMTQFALDYVKEAEEDVEFVEYNGKDALRALKEKECAAVIVLQAELIDSILSGENAPVLVVCNEDMEAAFFLRELTDAGAKLLSVAQAEIYALYDLVEQYEVEDALYDLQMKVNLNNITLAMGRDDLFHYKTVSATGNVSTNIYYLSSVLLATLLFLGMPMGMFLKGDQEVFLRQLTKAGNGAGMQQGCRLLAVVGIYTVLLCGVALALSAFGMEKIQVGVLLIVGVSIAAFVLCIYELVEKKSSAVLLLAFLTAVFLFVGGGIVPTVFLPDFLKTVSKCLPSTYWLLAGAEALSGTFYKGAVVYSLIYAVVFLGTAIFLRHRKVVAK